MAFRVGQKVVCVAHSIAVLNNRGLPGFVKGCVYTVSSLYEEDPHGLFLCSVELGPFVGGQVCGFRPVVERKTDISIFEKILTGDKQPARV